jgi:hypothetical protein
MTIRSGEGAGGRRLRREEPVRTEPIRDFSNVFRSAEAAEAEGGPEPPRQPWQDVVSRGVEMGYRVVEDQIRHGQRVAREVNERSYGFGRVGNDFREVTERTFRYYSEMTSLWMQLLGGVPGMGLWPGPWGGPPPQEGPAPAAWGPERRPMEHRWSVAVELDCDRPVTVGLDLHSSGESPALATHGLQALEAGTPPLSFIVFEPVTESGRDSVRLRIAVPKEQPSGVYTGAVFDARTGQGQGTLTVQLFERV